MKQLFLISILILTSCRKTEVTIKPTEPQHENLTCNTLLIGFYSLADSTTYWFNESNLDTLTSGGYFTVKTDIDANMVTFTAPFNFCTRPIFFWTHDLFFPVGQFCSLAYYQAEIQSNNLVVYLDDDFLTDCPTSERGGFYFAVPFSE